MESRDILKKLDRIGDLPTLPAIVMEVNRMIEDYDTSIKQLSRTIEKDQSMVSRILKLVNSAFFGLRSKVSNIPHAITLLGFNTVRNAVISVAVVEAFSGKDSLEGFDPADFWVHSVGVAVVSRSLAEQTRIQVPDDCFIGGLLHDIGKLVLACYFQDHFKTVWMLSVENNLSFYEAEKEKKSMNHALIGGHLARKWQLPPGLMNAIRYHHIASSMANDINILMVVHTADAIINRMQCDSERDPGFSTLDPRALEIFRGQIDTLSDWFPEVSEEIQVASEFFIKGEKR